MPLRLHTPIPPLRDASRWVNSAPIDVSRLRGKPVLVHFFSMSCESCKEQFPWIREWARRYEGRLHLIGVHTPVQVEDMDEVFVEESIHDLKLTHPIALDGDDGALADAYQVHFTPSYFLFDAEGTLRHYHAGLEAGDPVARALERIVGEAEGAHVQT